jgi:hypothetical protein
MATTVVRDLYRRYQFFKANGAHIGGEKAKCALRSARAEIWAFEHDVEFLWEDDSRDYDDSLGDHAYWCTDEQRGECQGHEITWCQARMNDEIVASLGAIIDADRTYRRVVQAELACEVMYE